MPSASEMQLKHRKSAEKTFTLDGKFVRDETREALRSFFTPFSGVYAAAVGKEVRVVNARLARKHKRAIDRKKA